jgi:hypothetical protein
MWGVCVAHDREVWLKKKITNETRCYIPYFNIPIMFSPKAELDEHISGGFFLAERHPYSIGTTPPAKGIEPWLSILSLTGQPTCFIRT